MKTTTATTYKSKLYAGLYNLSVTTRPEGGPLTVDRFHAIKVGNVWELRRGSHGTKGAGAFVGVFTTLRAAIFSAELRITEPGRFR